MKELLVLFIILARIDFGQSDEIIVRFNGYFDEVKRLEILKEASLPFLPFTIRGNVGFSDFEVLNEAPNSLKHPLIRDINISNSTTRQLNSKQILTRRRVGLDILNVAQKVGADKLWSRGFLGEKVRIAIFDTGLTPDRKHFQNVAVERDYTDEGTPNDLVGHGTFVAGVIAGVNRKCPGLAPKSELYIYKVFARNQESRTSWFLDAFNDALQHRVDIINLSIGGTDYMDKLFMKKVEEVIERGIIFVSAVGNDGPTFGSINNPADHSGVIGVGAVNRDNKLAAFSSRGMTSMEFPEGYGRIKPDLLTFGVQLRSAALNGGCKRMSGTSVATPIVTGSIALLLSSIPVENRNSMSIHQILKAGSEKLEGISMLEQGAGQLNLLNSFIALQEYKPQIIIFPSYLNMDDCPYMWPYCSQPLYFSSMPLIMNLTLNNGYNSTAAIKTTKFEYNYDQRGDLLEIAVENSARFDKAGFLTIFIQLNESAANFTGLVDGQLKIEFELKDQKVNVEFPIRVKIIPRPSKSKRIIWDQFRNLNYPNGYFPRDDLRSKQSPLDWNTDHPHSNFRSLYNTLRENGFFVEVSGHPLTCTSLSSYGTLMVVDSEEEFFPQELFQIKNAVENGLNLIVIGDWYNAKLIDEIKFEDPNSKQKQCQPETGGSNVPALNSLLQPFGFAFGDQVLEGKANLFNREIRIGSGAQLRAAPSTSWISISNLNDIAPETLNKTKTTVENAVIFGLNWPSNVSGMVSIFGDSNCFELNDCTPILIEILNITRDEFVPQQIGLKKSFLEHLPLNDLPKRIEKSKVASRVVSNVHETYVTYKLLPHCSTKDSIRKIMLNGKLDIRFDNSNKDLKEKARKYFGNSIQSDTLIDQNDYQDYDSEILAKNLVQYYTYRFLYFISAFLLISFILSRHRIRYLILKPFMRIFTQFAQ